MKLGYIGIGLMGKPMVLRLLAAGEDVTVWNRSRGKLAPLLEKGAKQAATPAGLAGAVDVAMMCVTDQGAAEEVLFGKDGVASGARPGLIVVDFSSIAPAAAVAFSQRLERQRVVLIDAPVSGGVPGAEKGTLAVMAGGPAEAIERVRPVVAHLAQRFTRMGDSGAGQATKLCNQVIVAALMAVIAEAVRLAEAARVDATKLPEALQGGFADSLPLQIFGARMAARTFEPSLGAARLMLKDLSNALDFATARGVPLPMGEAAREMYRLLERQGKIDREISALVTAYESRRDQ